MKKMKDLKPGTHFVLLESIPTAIEDEFLFTFRAVAVIDSKGEIKMGRLNADGVVTTCDDEELESDVIELLGLR